MEKIKNRIHDLLYGNTVAAVIRIILGILFVYSGSIKLFDPVSFSNILLLYDILPQQMIHYVAIILPSVELLTGLCLIIGYKIKAASLIIASLLVVFSAAISISLLRGKNFDCGCFEFKKLGIAIEENISFLLIIRNIILFLISVIVFKVKRNMFSFENYIEKERIKNL